MDDTPPPAPEINAPCARRRPPRLSRTAKLAVLAIAAALMLALGAWGFSHYGSELREAIHLGLDKVRSAGPLTFFAAMATLPSLGCPISVFTLTVGPLFGPQLGMPLVILITLGCIACNLALSYWLACRALRPTLARLVAWLGYTLPKARAEDYRTFVFLLRVTPGPPFFLQNYLLGLAHIPFGIYFTISGAISGAYALAFVLFGDAVMHGHGKQVMLALGLFGVLTVTVQWLRRRFRKQREAAAAASLVSASHKEGA